MIYAIPLIFASLIFKRHEFIPYIRKHWWRTGVFGGGMCAIAYALVVWALMYAPMAHVSALRETSVVFAALIGMFVLGESFLQQVFSQTAPNPSAKQKDRFRNVIFCFSSLA